MSMHDPGRAESRSGHKKRGGFRRLSFCPSLLDAVQNTVVVVLEQVVVPVVQTLCV